MFLTLSKQIINRFFVAEFILSMVEGLLRMTLQRPAQAYNSKFSKELTKVISEGTACRAPTLRFCVLCG
jgi:hypothetical protein